MTAAQLADFLWFHVWWKYPPNAPTLHDQFYSGFNVLEGIAWLALATYVLARFAKQRRSGYEVAYAVSFATFGVTDFIEAHALTSWLIAIKGVNLAGLLWLRAVVTARYYPGRAL